MSGKGKSARRRRVNGVVFDLDGTLVLSDRSLGNYEVLPGAREVLAELRTRGVPFLLLTNGSAYPPAQQAAKLRALGLPVEDAQMLTPSSVAADLFARRGHRCVLVLGGEGVGHALRARGIATLAPGQATPAPVDAVYVGWHPGCTMPDIEAAAMAIWAGARLYTASDVRFFATKGGRTIGYSYAIVGALRRLTGARAVVTGKPSLHAMRYAARQLGLDAARIAVVGDDPLVEILMARRAGGLAVGVTSGVTSAAEWRRQVGALKPELVLRALPEILARVSPP